MFWTDKSLNHWVSIDIVEVIRVQKIFTLILEGYVFQTSKTENVQDGTLSQIPRFNLSRDIIEKNGVLMNRF